MAMTFCSHCGARLVRRIPAGDDRPREVCTVCGTVHYENPKVVVGCVPAWGDRILLCRRAIAPRHGLWTLPAGYLENGETVAEGARRETLEEAGTRVTHLVPYGLYNLAFVNQVYVMFRARLETPDFSPGSESLDVRLFEESDIPWDELAFSVVRATLERYCRDRPQRRFPFHVHDIVPGG